MNIIDPTNYANVFAVVHKNRCNGGAHKQVVNCTKYI